MLCLVERGSSSEGRARHLANCDSGKLETFLSPTRDIVIIDIPPRRDHSICQESQVSSVEGQIQRLGFDDQRHFATTGVCIRSVGRS